ncbi:2TM domain-containing protein [Aeromonas simiae]|uniref:2TM domain-containing protein n=1 Tax=Aeromonas simiae TaxID=218936 RepID=UPI0005A88C97|nr:2TM domain-containing protein [Aeromonas simiae]MDO2949993.1 2TM domain-containing protein [Aeromonas simiae]MDO2953281.1 2TM domain-containing protein [Aeromonas simiae]MDO2957382.1 2TM domain-containing protein [Aeromonas simiae]
MIVRKLRLQRGWSQDQLATLSGLSVRTVQRIERGQAPGLESLKALAAVFEIELSQLQGNTMLSTSEQGNTTGVSREEREAMEYVQALRGFYGHLITYVVVIAALFVINLLSSPHYIWAVWPMLGWGIGVAVHAFNLFRLPRLFGPQWERNQIEKRLGRKL